MWWGSISWVSEWVSVCCLTPTQQFFCYIIMTLLCITATQYYGYVLLPHNIVAMYCCHPILWLCITATQYCCCVTATQYYGYVLLPHNIVAMYMYCCHTILWLCTCIAATQYCGYVLLPHNILLHVCITATQYCGYVLMLYIYCINSLFLFLFIQNVIRKMKSKLGIQYDVGNVDTELCTRNERKEVSFISMLLFNINFRSSI